MDRARKREFEFIVVAGLYLASKSKLMTWETAYDVAGLFGFCWKTALAFCSFDHLLYA